MSKKEKAVLVSKLRFPEFANSSVVDFKNGNVIFEPINNKNHNSDLPVLAITQDRGAFPREMMDYNVSVSDKSLDNYKIVEIGDFIISLRSFQGGIEYSLFRGICSPVYIILRKKVDIVEQYYKYYFKTNKFIQELNRNLEGIRDGKMVSYAQFSAILLPKPCNKEQQKIADCLSSLNDLINAENKKLALLKAHKKALMQKLFPAEGKTVPEIRFKSYDDAWEQRKLGTIAEFYSGLTYSPDNVIESGGTFVLRSSNVSNGEIVDADNIYVDSDVVNCRNVEIGDVIVVVRNGSRNLIGKHAQIKREMKNTVIGAFITGLRSNQSEFLDALLDTPQFDIEITKNIGATINQITTGAFKEMVFSIPTDTAEQTTIGDFFRTIDGLITVQADKIEALKTHKKGLMQGLFPSVEEAGG